MTRANKRQKVAVVIGGSGGIGAAAAKQLAGHGYKVIVTYAASKAKAEALLGALPGAGHHAARAVVEDTPTLAALAEKVADLYGGADILVNTAGFTTPIAHGDLDRLTDELIDRMFVVNWRGVFASIRAFRPLLESSGDGLIVNVSSIAGANGVGSNVAYAAVKAGIDVMTKSLARALAPKIRVMAVSPGVVDTGFVPGRGVDFNDKIAPTIPLKRVATPDDVASAIVACATHLVYSTGSTIVVDGGRAL